MAKSLLLFQGYGEERVIGEKGVGQPYHAKRVYNSNQVGALHKSAVMFGVFAPKLMRDVTKQGGVWT